MQFQSSLTPWQTVRIRATSSFVVTVNPACGIDPTPGPFPLDPNGFGYPPSDPRSSGNFYNLRVFPVDSGVTVTSAFPDPLHYEVGAQSWYQDQGNGPWLRYTSNTYNDRSLYAWATRTAEATWYCQDPSGGTHPSDLLSGSQTIVVEPVLFNVTPSAGEFDPGDTVHFAVETELTASAVSWTFRYTAGGTLSLTGCSNQLTCDVAPTGSGRMEVQLRESVTSSYLTGRSIEVVQGPPPCPEPTDWIAGNAAVQRGLRALLDSAQAWGPPGGRRERFAGIWENITTGELKVLPLAPLNATVCTQDITATIIISPGPDWRIVAGAHVHPFRGQTATDTSEVVPLTCPTSAAGQPVGRGEFIPSPDDWNTMMATDLWGRPLPGYIISSRFIVKFDAASINAGDETKRDGLTERWRWNSPSCRMRDMAAPPIPAT